MAYEAVMLYHLHMPFYFLETFTECPESRTKKYFVFLLLDWCEVSLSCWRVYVQFHPGLLYAYACSLELLLRIRLP